MADRSIPIRLKRRSPGERVERFRRRDAAEQAESLRIDAESLAAYAIPALTEARPELPEALSDRAADVWEPLLAIADHAGGDWPARARQAAVALSSGDQAEDESVGIRLLAEALDYFDLLAQREPAKYERAALRWHPRLERECAGHAADQSLAKRRHESRGTGGAGGLFAESPA